MQRFTVPRDVYFGENALDYLKELDGKKAMVVVGGGSMKRFGFLDTIVNNIKEAGLEVELIEGVEPDPSVTTVKNGAKKMEEFEPDWIVAVGGGSPIDAAKGMWIFYEHPDAKFEDLTTPFSFPKLRNKAKFLAITSTSGTGTEVTAFSVITDYDTGIKWPLADFEITPDVAIVDPALAQTMPPKLVAYTGMDALTHAIEAYVGLIPQPFTDALALDTIQRIFKDIYPSFNGDEKAREEMHYSQCMAGMAFSNALLGIVHSLAHKTGAAFSTGHIPHGCANAIYLPYVIKFNSYADASRYGNIGRFLGMEGTDDEIVNQLCDLIRSYNKKMNIPATLKEFGVLEEEFNEKVADIAAHAQEDACTGTNPRKTNPQLLEKLLTYIYHGKEIDF
ncbi:MAG: iron-containing alcohol dehydrogenase [Methanobacteriaceae archaeon]|nr:iron-containing alcohol dehydrogenase [Methanobacteriaceae archaeon]